MRFPTPFAALLVIVGVPRDAEAQSRLARPVIDTVSGHIVRVTNNGPTTWTDTNGWKLVYERTIQPPDGTPGMLEKPAGVVLLDGGQLITWGDWQHPSITLYDAHGGLERELGRVGDGPGEYRSVEVGLVHDTLIIQDQKLGRVTLMTVNGRLVRSFQSVCCAYPGAVGTGGRLIRITAGAGEWHLFDFAGQPRGVFAAPQARKASAWEFRTSGGSGRADIPFGGLNRQLQLANGSIVYGITNRSEFLVTNNGKDTARIFGTRHDPAVVIPDPMRDSMFRAFTRQPEVAAVAHPSDVPTTYPLWDALYHDGAGNIWLQRGGMYGTAVRRFDVFAADGRLLGAVSAPLMKPVALAWSRDHLAVLDQDDNDLPRIRIFRVDRRGH
jgi:hypothetical protein